MTSLSQNLTGNRVFKASSFAPNRGPVSAQGATGYLQRGLDQQATATITSPKAATPAEGSMNWGADGESDNRSGVAASSLSRSVTSNKNDPNETSVSFRSQPTHKVIPGLWTTKPATAVAPTKATPVVEITNVGSLKLPYDFKSAGAVLSAKEAADKELLSARQARQQAASQYLVDTNAQASAYAEDKATSGNISSSRGNSFSSAYGKTLADNATKNNTLVQGLNSNETAGKNNDTANRSRIAAGFKRYLGQMAVSQGYTLDQKAGTFNLNKVPKKTPPKKTAPKKSSKGSKGSKK